MFTDFSTVTFPCCLVLCNEEKKILQIAFSPILIDYACLGMYFS